MTLFRTLEPLPGESLPGMVARAAALNVYPRSFDVLAQAGLDRFHPQAIAMRDVSLANDLAEVFGTEPGKLVPLFHPSDDGGKTIDFFGIKLRAVHREAMLRRVSPRALKISPHVRAVWHLRPLTFDPGTKELLLSHCPVCGEPLGFTVTRGVAFCDQCTRPGRYDGLEPSVDLRDFPQPLVEVDDLEALDFVTGLVDPDPDVRANFAPPLHDDLASLDRSEIFELALAVGTALMAEADPEFVPNAERVYRAKTRAIDPDALSIAGRALLDWPRGYLNLLKTASRRVDERDAHWGRLKELGAFGTLAVDEFLSRRVKALLADQKTRFFLSTPVARNTVRRAKERDPTLYIGAKELRNLAGVEPRVVTALGRHPRIIKYRTAPPPAPVVFIRTEVEPILRRYKDLVSEESAAFRIGVPVETMRDFEAAGYITHSSGIESELVDAAVSYPASELDRLFGYYYEVAPFGERSPDFVAFNEAMLMFPSGRRPWFALWETILRGNIDTLIHREMTKTLTDVVLVRTSEIDRVALAARMTELPKPDIDAVTIGNARLMLGIMTYPAFTACVTSGLLTPNEDKTLPYSQVMDFAARYAFSNEVSVRSGIGRQKVRRWLEERGVAPAWDLGVKGSLIYRRADIEPFLGLESE